MAGLMAQEVALELQQTLDSRYGKGVATVTVVDDTALQMTCPTKLEPEIIKFLQDNYTYLAVEGDAFERFFGLPVEKAAQFYPHLLLKE